MLSGEKAKALFEALLDGFPNEDELTQMVRFGMGERLQNISMGKSGKATIYALVDWADSQGRVEELVKAAREANPQNPLLQALNLADGPQNERERHRVVHLPQRRNLYFLDFADVLSKIEKAFQKSERVVLHGIGGIGKTQTAYEYARKYGDDYADGVFWINAASRDTTLDSLADLADASALALDLPEDATQDDRVKAVRRELAHRPNALFIYDSMDWLFDLEGEEFQNAVAETLPQNDDSRALLTSRQTGGGAAFLALPIRAMTPEESALLLVRYARQEPELADLDAISEDEAGAARELADLLGGLPLALEQAGATVAEDRFMTLRQYVERYKSPEGARLRKEGARFGVHESTYYTFISAMEQVVEQHPNVMEMLGLCAFLAPVPVPFFVFLPNVLDEEMQNRVRDAVRYGVRYRLLDFDNATQSVTMHRVVGDVVRDVVEEDGARYYKAYAANSMSHAFPDADYSNWTLCARLLPHALLGVQYVDELKMQTDLAARLLNQVALYLNDQRNAEDALPLYERALAICESLETPNPILTAAVLSNTGNLYNQAGEQEKAIGFFERALAIHKKMRKSGHPYAATFLNNMAMTYTSLGEFAKAQSLFKRALTIANKTEAADTPLKAQILNNMGLAYMYQGEYAKALPLYEQAVAMCQKTRGREHPQTAQALNNLAFLRFQRGELEEADAIYRDSLAIYEKTLGPEHPETVNAITTQGILCEARGDTAGSIALLERARAILATMRKPKEEAVARTLNYLGKAYYTQGKYAVALPLYQEALTHFQNAFGPMHPETATVQNNLALLYTVREEFDKAEAAYAAALAMYENSGAMQNPQVVLMLNNRGLTAIAHGKPDDALKHLEQARAICEKAGATETPFMAQCLSTIAMIYVLQERISEAEPLIAQALAICEKLPGQNDLVRAQCLTIQARVIITTSDFATVKGLLEEAAAIYEASIGLTHPDAFLTVVMLGPVLAFNGEFERAKAMLEASLSRLSDLFSAQHPIATALMQALDSVEQLEAEAAQQEPTPLVENVTPAPDAVSQENDASCH